ncbi:hypothetical protein ScPMuIL_011999 [Solemya velum]
MVRFPALGQHRGIHCVLISGSGQRMKSNAAKLHGRCRETTFQNDNSLPSLPLAPLHQTLRKYLDSVKPHLTKFEYQRTENCVEQFEHGIGTDLYSKLQEKAKVSKNWLETWWEQSTYLDKRSPIQLFNVVATGPSMLYSLNGSSCSQNEAAVVTCSCQRT